MNMLVGSAAVATATALPHQPASAMPLYDPEKVSPELRDLMRALCDVNDVLKEKAAIYDAIHEQYTAWSKLNPEPRMYGSRIYRKWENRHDKLMARIGFYEAQENWRDAADDQQKARKEGRRISLSGNFALGI
jgi:GTP cyclohydrolase II